MSKIGFNLLAWSTGVDESMYPIIERLKNIGYDGIEFFYGSDKEEDYRRLGAHCNDLGIRTTGVMVLGPDQNPIHPDEKIRNKGLDQIKWAVDQAHTMGAELICGPFHSSNGVFENRPATEDEYKRSAEILNQAGEYAEKAGVILAPEAINRFECYLVNTMDQMKKLLDLTDHPQVVAHYDTHHANIEEKSVLDALRTIAARLGHVHISENDRGTPGEGQIRFEETFAALKEVKYDGWLTIEAFTRNDVGFANAINVWREYSPPWEVAEKGFELIKRLADQYGIWSD